MCVLGRGGAPDRDGETDKTMVWERGRDARVYTHTHTHTHTRTHARTHARTRTRMHAHTHTHTDTDMHAMLTYTLERARQREHISESKRERGTTEKQGECGKCAHREKSGGSGYGRWIESIM